MGLYKPKSFGMQFNDILRTQMMLQLPQGRNPLLNLMAMNGFDLAVKTYPTWSSWVSGYCCRRKREANHQHILSSVVKTPRASISCERATGLSQGNKAQQVQGVYANRMDAVIHFVTTLPAMKTLLSVTHHDYLPHEFDPVCLEKDVYFELQDMKVVDGQLEIVKFKLFCYDHDVQHLQNFVESCNADYERRQANKLGAHRYFFDQVVQTRVKGSMQNPLPTTHLLYSKTRFTTNRTFDNVFFEERKQVEKRTKFFLENRAWYDKKGIPYTLGFMFHGPPGTGKTSTIKAIASEGKRHIINIQLSEIKTKQQLQHLFFNDEIHVYNGTSTEKFTIPVSERLYVVEDIDAMGDMVLRREWKKPIADVPKKKDDDMFSDRKEEDKEVIDLSFLLNLLDGTLEANGRIIVFSTNFPERIDRALVRPGRVDMIIHFKKCSTEILQEMIAAFYDTEVEDLTGFPNLNNRWTPAEVNQILFRNFDSSTEAIADLIRSAALDDIKQENDVSPDGVLALVGQSSP
jgi:chromosomal replication initiation ATPase DnaA